MYGGCECLDTPQVTLIDDICVEADPCGYEYSELNPRLRSYDKSVV